jgi:hypothetical protein
MTFLVVLYIRKDWFMTTTPFIWRRRNQSTRMQRQTLAVEPHRGSLTDVEFVLASRKKGKFAIEFSSGLLVESQLEVLDPVNSAVVCCCHHQSARFTPTVIS